MPARRGLHQRTRDGRNLQQEADAIRRDVKRELAAPGGVAGSVPVGGMILWPDLIDLPEGGWVLTDGSSLERGKYAKLYAAIRDRYGSVSGAVVLPNIAAGAVVGGTVTLIYTGVP